MTAGVHPRRKSAATVTFAFGQAVVIKAERSTLHHGLDAHARWPCPGCAVRRLLDDSWLVTVHDRDGAHRRDVLLCAACVTSTGIVSR